MISWKIALLIIVTNLFYIFITFIVMKVTQRSKLVQLMKKYNAEFHSHCVRTDGNDFTSKQLRAQLAALNKLAVLQELDNNHDYEIEREIATIEHDIRLTDISAGTE